MTSKERVLQRERDRAKPVGKVTGRADALDLAARAATMTETEIIAEEEKVPMFVWGTDYSGCPVGSPIGEIVDGELQIFAMLTPVNTAHYPGITPNTERSLFSLMHTKDPAKAKDFVPAQGTSGLYKMDECCKDPLAEDPTLAYRCIVEQTNFRPSEYPAHWEVAT